MGTNLYFPQFTSEIIKMSAAGSLRENFFAMAKRVESLSGIIDPREPDSLIYAKGILNAVIEDLEAMVIAGDATGENEASQLMSEINGLLQQTRGLKAHIDKAVEIQSSLREEAQAEATRSSTNEETSMDEEGSSEKPGEARKDAVRDYVNQQGDTPLDRQEIGKLLLLVARAHKTGVLSLHQKSFLKTQIVGRVGMLRVVLQLEGLEMIFHALQAISGPAATDE